VCFLSNPSLEVGSLQLSPEMYFFILAALSKRFPSWLILSSFYVLGFQSIKTKQHLLENIIRSTYPDIIFGTEIWIDNSIKDSQIFPRGYTIFRNDRNFSGGGVLIHFVAV
jgi:hypothetical protein